MSENEAGHTAESDAGPECDLCGKTEQVGPHIELSYAPCEACPFLGCLTCDYRGGMWRVDAIKTVVAPAAQPEWYLDQRTAERRADELMKAGWARAIAWFDCQGKGIPRDEGRQLVRNGLQAAFGRWLNVDDTLEGTA